MREMKDSGIEWIGEIPKEWEIIRMKNMIISRDGGAWGEEKSNDENDVICLRIADFDYQRLRFKDTNELTIRNYKSEVKNKLLLLKDDILIEKSGGGEKTPVGRAVIFDKKYEALFANFMERLRTRNNVNPKYFLYILTAFYQNRHMLNYIKQTTGIQNLDISSLLSIERSPFSSISEQQEISAYLDEKCTKIDTIIEKQQKIIEKLKAYKLSLITETVIKGLNPDVKMKDSGYEFIGTVPEHWNVCRLRNIGTPQNGISKGGDFFGHGYPFVSYGDVYRNFLLPETMNGLVETTEEEREQYSVKEGDIFFTRTSETIEEVGFSCVCEKTIKNATFAGFVIRLRPFVDDLVTGFAKYYFRSNHHRFYLVKEMNLVTRASLGQNLLKSMPVLLPPKKEQQEIANYLDKKCSAIAEAIAKKQTLIEKLKEYKKSLIYEVVTGKKEV